MLAGSERQFVTYRPGKEPSLLQKRKCNIQRRKRHFFFVPRWSSKDFETSYLIYTLGELQELYQVDFDKEYPQPTAAYD